MTASCFQVTEEAYVPVSDMNGLGFKPFDLVIPFAVRKGEITGKLRHECLPLPLPAPGFGNTTPHSRPWVLNLAHVVLTPRAL